MNWGMVKKQLNITSRLLQSVKFSMERTIIILQFHSGVLATLISHWEIIENVLNTTKKLCKLKRVYLEIITLMWRNYLRILGLITIILGMGKNQSSIMSRLLKFVKFSMEKTMMMLQLRFGKLPTLMSH